MDRLVGPLIDVFGSVNTHLASEAMEVQERMFLQVKRLTVALLALALQHPLCCQLRPL